MNMLGKTVTDKITGFTGVVTGYCMYITGCNQCLVAPKMSADGTSRSGEWYDEQRLVVDESVKAIVLDNSKSPGFDKPAPIR